MCLNLIYFWNVSISLSYLVSTANQIQIMSVQEFGHNVSAERKAYASIIFAPTLFINNEIIFFIFFKYASTQRRRSLACTSLSGSLHNRSQSSPVSGTSVGRIMRRICSMPCRSGLRPPWQQNIFSSIIAAIGKQLKQSVNVFHNLMLYLRLHSS